MNGIKLCSTLGMGRPAWLEWRRKGIGGSDAGAILGLNPYSSAFSVWCDKKGLLPEKEDNEAMRQGRDLEQYVAERFTETTGKAVRRCNYLLAHPEYPWMLANVDRLVIGEDAGLECKTTSILTPTDYDAGDVPPQYYVQCQHYMAVTGCVKWYLAVLVLNKKFHIFEIVRNEAEVAALIAAEKSFWEGNVLAGVEPAPDGSERAGEVISSLYPGGQGGTAPLYGMEQAAQDYLFLSGQIKALERQKDECKQRIQVEMKEAEEGVLPGYRVTWRAQTRTSVDTKALREDMPDVYEKYSRTETVRTFRLKEAK